jgi:flagellar assembly protein FliH
MSARIILAEMAEEPDEGRPVATPVLWRPAGAHPSHGPAGPAAAGQATHRADAKAVEAHSTEVEQRVQTAHQTGYAAGLAAGTQQATERMQPVLASFAAMIQELSQLKKQYRHSAEASTVGLALAVARRILYREIAADPEAVLGLVKAAFDKCNARETHRLVVSPADLAVIREHAPRLGFPPALEITSDPKLPRGSAIFETSRGDLDASADTQLLEIERGFTDIIRRRSF